MKNNIDTLSYYNLYEDSSKMLDELAIRYPELNWLWVQVDNVVSERNKLDDAAWRNGDLEDQVEDLKCDLETVKADAKLVASRIEQYHADHDESLDELHEYVLDMLNEMSR